MKKIIFLLFEKKLRFIFDNNDKIVDQTFNNFFKSLNNFNLFLITLINIYTILALIINLFLIVIFFFKLKLNFFPLTVLILSKIPFIKNINNFITANLLLHLD